jgi:hypothetical protein
LRVAGTDKQHYTRLPGIATFLEFGTRETRQIQNFLNKFSRVEKEKDQKKRVREEAEADDEDVLKRVKRNKGNDVAIESLIAGMMATGHQSDDEMDES